MALTDISGIGAKTAERLREKGITSKQQLLQAYKDNDRRVTGGLAQDSPLNSRALEGIRNELANTGESFVDPVYGVPVTKENERARKAFDLELGSDVAKGFGSFTRDKGGVDAGMNVLNAASEAIQGNLGKMFSPDSYEDVKTTQYGYGDSDMTKTVSLEESDEADRATKEAFEFGLDAAANLSSFERDTLKSGNELARQTAGMGAFTVEQTEETQRETSQGTIEAEDNIGIQSSDYARARKAHMERSGRARDVDNQRKAEITSDYEEWREDPSRHDFPSVDTPGGRKDILTEGQQEQAQQIDEVIRGADEDVAKVAFENPLEEMF